MNQVSAFGRNVFAAGAAQPRYAFRVIFGGMVRVTTDPIEVARIRRAYPAARVEVVPIG
jgi:hypothetical protein